MGRDGARRRATPKRDAIGEAARPAAAPLFDHRILHAEKRPAANVNAAADAEAKAAQGSVGPAPCVDALVHSPMTPSMAARPLT